jgi:surface antigen
MRIRRRSDRRVFVTRRIGVALLIGLLAAVAPVLHPERVSAASGVDDYPARLKNAGLDALVDPWQFYNRECTSWVAWRLNSENQVAFTDYWQGVHWGNASNWRNAARSLNIPVDDNPTRGAVAWWSAGSAGSSRGHVAWVQTVSDGAITIEEYNYLRAGFYDTRTISRSSSMWPSGFIHIKDTVVRNTAAPVVRGTAQVGRKVRTSNGTWSATNLVFHYQWLANGVPIAGATAKSFKPTASQLGQRLRAKVIATKSGSHNGSATSPPTDSVAHGVFTLSADPVISGTPQVGVQLSAGNGTWSPAGAYTYHWYAGDTQIPDVTISTFTPTAAQLGQPIRVKVTSRLVGYKTMSGFSTPTAQVVPGQFKATEAPSISGTAQVDQVLTANPGTWTPAGRLHLQWLADGAPIAGATGTTYAVTPADLRKVISLQVTVTQVGYADAVADSANTSPIAPGTFLNTREPAVLGTAQVGVPLTADKGAWTPKASLAYQWVVGGTEVVGATSKSFTPRPQDLGQPVTVEILASRPGYLTALVTSPATAATLPGVFHATKVPEITGRPMVGHTLHASSGTWSLDGVTPSYQWYAGASPITGATEASYQPTADEAGQPIHVVVTASSPGYTSESATSTDTDPVLLGVADLAQPTVTGKAVLGRTLTAHVATFSPASATPRYRWMRGREPIRGAHAPTYALRRGDVGHSVHVEVTMRARNWVSATRRSMGSAQVRTVPVLHVHTSIRNGRVFLRLRVVSPGLAAAPGGSARALRHHTSVGRFPVVDGRGSRLLAPMRAGTHTITVLYLGGAMETPGRISVPVTIP